jgi:hypothetical protein
MDDGSTAAALGQAHRAYAAIGDARHLGRVCRMLPQTASGRQSADHSERRSRGANRALHFTRTGSDASWGWMRYVRPLAPGLPQPVDFGQRIDALCPHQPCS